MIRFQKESDVSRQFSFICQRRRTNRKNVMRYAVGLKYRRNMALVRIVVVLDRSRHTYVWYLCLYTGSICFQASHDFMRNRCIDPRRVYTSHECCPSFSWYRICQKISWSCGNISFGGPCFQTYSLLFTGSMRN